MKPLIHACLLLFLCFIPTFSLFAQPGTLVPSFGTKGKITDPSRQAFEKAITSQPDNKLLIGSQGFYQGYQTFLIDRLLPDGTKDASFGTGGTAFILFPGMNIGTYLTSVINAITILPDGKIIAAGHADGGRGAIALARFTTGGLPDSSFGTNGTSLTGFNFDETITGLAFQPDGKLVVCGTSMLDGAPGNTHFFVARYLSNGKVDSSFGNKGIVVSSYRGTANAIVIQPDGKIVAGGYNSGDDGVYFHIERYSSTGSYDNSFGADGVTDSRINGGFLNFINDIALQKNGSIIAAGRTISGGAQTFTVVRYNSNGSFDNSFGSGGVVTTSFIAKTGEAEKVMLTKNEDHIIVAGSSTGSTGSDFVVAAYHITNGTLDTAFGNAGIETTDFGGSDFDNSATLCANGKIVALGSNTGQYPFAVRALAQYNGYPLTVSLWVKIKRWLQNHTLSWSGLPAEDAIAYYNVEQSGNGRTGFIQIATVNGAAHLAEYSLTNSHLLQGANYYRIQAVSTDGTVRYSEVVTIDNLISSLSVYPNPAIDVIIVKGLQTGVTSHISITNGNGNVMMKGINNGSAQHRFAVNNLQAGTYYINIITPDGKKEMVMFVKE